MSYSKVERFFPAGIGAAGHLGALDMSDASGTTEFTWVPQTKVVIYGFGFVVTEAMGTMTTTEGVASLTIGSTEHSTAEATPSAAIGTETLGTQFDPVTVAVGTSVIFKVKTQAVDGTVVGEGAPFVICEFFHNLAPA